MKAGKDINTCTFIYCMYVHVLLWTLNQTEGEKKESVRVGLELWCALMTSESVGYESRERESCLREWQTWHRKTGRERERERVLAGSRGELHNNWSSPPPSRGRRPLSWCALSADTGPSPRYTGTLCRSAVQVRERERDCQWGSQSTTACDIIYMYMYMYMVTLCRSHSTS